MICTVCKQESTFEKLTKKATTGIKRIRGCKCGSEFSTIQNGDDQEKPALVLKDGLKVQRLRRQMLRQAFLDCRFEGKVQPGTLALAERIRKQR